MREELKRTEDSIANRIGCLESSVKNIQTNLQDLEEQVESADSRMEEKIEELIANRLTEVGRHPRGNMSESWGNTANFTELPSSRDKRYWKARRSLRMWPVEGEGEEMKSAVLKFLANKLRLGEDVIADAEECHIVRVPTAGPGPSQSKNTIRHEVVVEFPSVDLRDLVRRSAYNLAGDRTAGIRLDVPHHFMKNFKALESASYKLKQQYPSLRRNIKFDDEVCDLVLEFRISEGGSWKRLRPQEAKELQRAEGEAEDMSASDVSSLLSGNGGSVS